MPASFRRLLLSLLLSLALPACGGDDGGGDGSVTDGGTDAAPDAPMVDCPPPSGMLPEGRGEHVAFYDAARRRLLVFGGNVAEPRMCNPVRPDYDEAVWVFRPDCGSWERLVPEGDSPLGRSRMALAYDSERDRVLLFGGRRRGTMGYTNYAEVWAFDLATDTWELLAPSGEEAPAPRNAAAAAYDPERDELLIFGGNTSSSGLTYQAVDDTWAFDLQARTWRNVDATGPSARIFAAGAMLGGKFYVYGGTADFFGPILGDLWALDPVSERWEQVGREGAPRTRFAAQLLADEAGGRLLVLMGHDDTSLGNSNDVWAYDPTADAWSELHAGDQLNAEPGGFCDFPADFVRMEADSPERRHMFAAAIGPEAAYVTMGKTDCGNVNDVWAMDLSSGAWRNLSPATEGESCERRGETCSSLCF